MKQATRDRAMAMLFALLEQGQTYRQVAREYGLGHSTVERQVKCLLWQVARSSPIRGVPDVSIASLAQMRHHADSILAAVRSAPAADHGSASMELDDDELLAGVRRIRRLSENANRDVALLFTLLCTGAKPLEVARLVVEDYLCPDGSVRRASELREEAATRGRARKIFFDSDSACEAIDAYLEERLRRRIGISGRASYRGLDPKSGLFLTEAGKPFLVRARSATDLRPKCPTLLATYSRIFQRAGWRGINTQHLRRLFALRVAAKGADKGQLAELLGVEKPSVKRLLNRHPRPLTVVVKDLV